jgi:hypothetical protein
LANALQFIIHGNHLSAFLVNNALYIYTGFFALFLPPIPPLAFPALACLLLICLPFLSAVRVPPSISLLK